MPNGSMTTTRKVMTQEGMRRLGIYNLDGTPVVGDVKKGQGYLARHNRRYIHVIAGADQLMYSTSLSTDPRAEEARRITAASGFDLERGQYVI